MLSFGRIDIPPGGKLPPAPTYATLDGRELAAEWRDETPADSLDGRRTYVPRFELNLRNFGLCILIFRTLARNSIPVREPWGHETGHYDQKRCKPLNLKSIA